MTNAADALVIDAASDQIRMLQFPRRAPRTLGAVSSRPQIITATSTPERSAQVRVRMLNRGESERSACRWRQRRTDGER